MTWRTQWRAAAALWLICNVGVIDNGAIAVPNRLPSTGDVVRQCVSHCSPEYRIGAQALIRAGARSG
ncbi:hypothetical protein MFM001_36770 [Mycobacterium sp. MFM001]|uniref:hypothetical protein n=1 Tax=Mycobacterium sp. MFM001 TaxID=2049453 RepID=UPI000DA49890|nr:hypothetical protein [Mycobacterium sp. MFM001]GBE67215.1 hypothetical protein MFM001_36770 [Mycobacterium sp. MFM001]